MISYYLAAPYKTVTEVIASQSASKKSKDDIALERKKQREERERKREENRKLREQRKAEREAVKEQRRSTSSLGIDCAILFMSLRFSS